MTFEQAVREMRRLQLEYQEASATNRFPADLWQRKKDAEDRVDALLNQPKRQAQQSLFLQG